MPFGVQLGVRIGVRFDENTHRYADDGGYGLIPSGVRGYYTLSLFVQQSHYLRSFFWFCILL